MRSNEFGSGPFLSARSKLFLLKELHNWTEPTEKVTEVQSTQRLSLTVTGSVSGDVTVE